MKPIGDFILKGATLMTVEASIYESRRGLAETNVFELIFGNGLSLKTKCFLGVNVDQIVVKGEDEEDRVLLAVDGHGTLQFIGETGELLFDGHWQTVEEPCLVIYNNLIADLVIPCEYSGTGINSYEGYVIWGKMIAKLTGLDESGIGIYEISGEGAIHNALDDFVRKG